MAEFNLEGLLGNVFGGGNYLDEYLTPEQRAAMQRNAMLAASAALLKAGGESTRRIGIGEALGGAFEAGQAGYEKAQTGALTQMALKQKMDEAKRAKALQERIAGVFAPQTAMPAVDTGVPPLPTSAGAAMPPAQAAATSMNQNVAMANQYRQVAKMLAENGQIEQAMKSVDMALKLDPPVTLSDKAKLLSELGLPPTVANLRLLEKPDRNIGTASPNDFTVASLARFDKSGNIEDLVRVPDKPSGAVDRAPTLTTIVDPTNPNQMLSINARLYNGGGVGSLGVLGVSGKEPGAATRQLKTDTGKSQLADDLSNLRASFLSLDAMKSIPSTQRSSLSNIASGISASAIGQKTGQMFGTEAQVERDVINSARSRLVNSIKNATGMSAQQLNSNVELQTMLRSISDPGHSIQAALRIIDDIEKAYVTGSSMAPPPSAAASQAPAAPAANISQQRQDANAAIAKGAPAAAVRQRFKQNTGQEL